MIKTGSFVNDKEEGDWKEFDEEGNLIRTITYKNGIEISSK
jgi:antitoxin component YwqK of YwqJK toxin-antitoxin module